VGVLEKSLRRGRRGGDERLSGDVREAGAVYIGLAFEGFEHGTAMAFGMGFCIVG